MQLSAMSEDVVTEKLAFSQQRAIKVLSLTESEPVKTASRFFNGVHRMFFRFGDRILP